jgi:hypothetical protein
MGLSRPVMGLLRAEFGSVSLAKSECYPKSRLSKTFPKNALHYRHLLRHIHGAGSSTLSTQAYLVTDANRWQHAPHALFKQRFYGLKNGFNELKKITTPIVLIQLFVVKGIPSHVSTNSRFTINF